MSIGGIEAISGFTPLAAPVVTAPAPAAAPATQGADFGSMVLDGIERLEGIQDSADTLAATEAETATKLTVAVRNKAIEAFSEIMRMQVG